jgi:hypothetical protein
MAIPRRGSYRLLVEPLLSVALTCRRCHHIAPHAFESAAVCPRPAEIDPAWDGICFSSIARCPSCGAEDDYDLTPEAHAMLVDEAARVKAHGSASGSRIISGVFGLSDGTIIQRPSEAIARLRARAEANPGSGEAWRRLANLYKTHRLPAEAEAVWRRAVEVDEHEAEAACCLAVFLWESGRPEESLRFLQIGLMRYPGAGLAPKLRREIGESFATILRDAISVAVDTLALRVAVETEERVGDQVAVMVSEVDLKRIGRWDRLAELLGSEVLVGAQLTADIPDRNEGPTQLERLLAGPQPPAKLAWKPGRSSLSKKPRRRPAA